MSDEVVVPFGDNREETAVLLLAAAEEAGVDPSVVRTGSFEFFVPKEIAEAAGVGDKPAKKAAAKKSVKE